MDQKEKFFEEIVYELTWLSNEYFGHPKPTKAEDEELLNQISGARQWSETQPNLENIPLNFDHDIFKVAKSALPSQRRTPIKKELVNDISRIFAELFYVVGKSRSITIPLKGTVGLYGDHITESSPCNEFVSVENNPVLMVFMWGFGLIFTTDFINSTGADAVRDLQSKGKKKLNEMLKDAKRERNEEKIKLISEARERGERRQILFGGGHGLNNERTSDSLVNTAIQVFFIALEKYLDLYKRETGKDLIVKRVLPLESKDYPEDRDAFDILNKTNAKNTNVLKANSKIIICQILYFLSIKNGVGGVFTVKNISDALKKKSLLRIPLKKDKIINMGIVEIISKLQEDLDEIVDMLPKPESGNRPYHDNKYLP